MVNIEIDNFKDLLCKFFKFTKIDSTPTSFELEPSNLAGITQKTSCKHQRTLIFNFQKFKTQTLLMPVEFIMENFCEARRL